MEQLIRVIVQALVDHPEQIRIEAREDARGVVYELIVHPSDVGKVIGKQGRIAKALRTVITSAAVREHRRVLLDIKSD